MYEQGHRHFGENYVQELLEKAPKLPADIKWHFIGQLQSNKAKALVAGVPNLWMVESVDSIKLANLLNKAVAAAAGQRAEPKLRVLVQVNTSGEAQKGGVQPGEEAVALASHIVSSCPSLHFCGLMTIGKLGEVASKYFELLAEEKARVSAALASSLPASELAELDLSMGMSGDFELAIQHGSTNVRVGSSIFGARVYAGSTAAAALSKHAEEAAASAGAGHHTDSDGEHGGSKAAGAAGADGGAGGASPSAPASATSDSAPAAGGVQRKEQ